MQCEFVNIGKKNSLLKIENEHFSSSNYMSWYFTPTFQLLSLKNEYTVRLPRFVAGLQRKAMKTSVEATICCRSPEKSHENISRRTSQGDIPVDSRVRVTIKRPRVSPPCPDGERSGVIGSMDMPIPRGAEGVMEWQILAKRSNLHLSHLNMEEKRKT